MEEEKLDKVLKNKLESLEPVVPKDAWKSFSEKLKNAESKDNIYLEEKFDSLIYKKLNQFILPSKERHAWAYFNEYYARIKRNERKIIWFKVMEVTLASLVFITCLQIDVLLPNKFYQLPVKESKQIKSGLLIRFGMTANVRGGGFLR